MNLEIFILITGGIVLLWVVTYLGKLYTVKKGKEIPVKKDSKPIEECCGTHEICEAELLAKLSAEIVYYEDEELDAYKNYQDDNYTDEQIEEFREVLYTLKENEIEEWLHSLEHRRITLPSVLKSELLFMLAKK